MRNRITLDTIKDVQEFVAIVSQLPCKVFLVCGAGFRVNAKSILGAMASMTFNELWVECETDIYRHIHKFIKIESDVKDNSTSTKKLLQKGFTF